MQEVLRVASNAPTDVMPMLALPPQHQTVTEVAVSPVIQVAALSNTPHYESYAQKNTRNVIYLLCVITHTSTNY